MDGMYALTVRNASVSAVEGERNDRKDRGVRGRAEGAGRGEEGGGDGGKGIDLHTSIPGESRRCSPHRR